MKKPSSRILAGALALSTLGGALNTRASAQSAPTPPQPGPSQISGPSAGEISADKVRGSYHGSPVEASVNHTARGDQIVVSMGGGEKPSVISIPGQVLTMQFSAGASRLYILAQKPGAADKDLSIYSVPDGNVTKVIPKIANYALVPVKPDQTPSTTDPFQNYQGNLMTLDMNGKVNIVVPKPPFTTLPGPESVTFGAALLHTKATPALPATPLSGSTAMPKIPPPSP